jgi:alkylation response protein AidB-like acyl-CoA dehydrogenase
MATVTQDMKQPKLPAPDVDLHGLAKTRPAEELATLKQVRDFVQGKVAPGIKCRAEDAFLFDLLPEIKELNLTGAGLPDYRCRGRSALLFGVIATKKVRSDASIATFMGVSGQAMGSVDFGGSEQKKKWLPPIDLELDFKNRVLYLTDQGDPVRGNTVKSPLDRRQTFAGNHDE